MKHENETSYAGFDYGLGTSNVDKTTGIRYGVIPVNEVCQAWSDSSEPFYGDAPICPDCELPVMDGVDVDPDIDCRGEYYCESCETWFDGDDVWPMEPLSDYVDNARYSTECTDQVDIFITKSPYFTYAQFCSPCAPGACYVMNPLTADVRSNANKCYCLGHDWFDAGIAPYDVFSVATGEMVTAPDEHSSAS